MELEEACSWQTCLSFRLSLTRTLLIFIESRPVYTTANTARFCCLWAFCLHENNARSARISKLWNLGSGVKSLTFPCKQERHFSVKMMSTAQALLFQGLAMLQCHHSLRGVLDTFTKLHNFRMSLFRLYFVLWCNFYCFGIGVIVNLFCLILSSSALTLSGSRGRSTMVGGRSTPVWVTSSLLYEHLCVWYLAQGYFRSALKVFSPHYQNIFHVVCALGLESGTLHFSAWFPTDWETTAPTINLK